MPGPSSDGRFERLRPGEAGFLALAEDGNGDGGREQVGGSAHEANGPEGTRLDDLGCRACATPGGGCQFLGTAATSQVVAEALGLTVPHAALAPSGQRVWTKMARQSARAVLHMIRIGLTVDRIVTDAAIRNAMAVHAAFGGSTNLLLHLPAVSHAAGRRVPDVSDWAEVNRSVPRLVSVLPNGPVPHPTVRVFLAGGVPEVMLHLRRLGLLDERALTATGETVGAVLDWWESSERRHRMRRHLLEQDGVDPDTVIFPPDRARAAGLASTVAFPTGNIAPEGSVVKTAAIDPAQVDEDGVYRHLGRAKVFTSERAAIRAIKDGRIAGGDILVMVGGGPSGTGMEETYQLTSALRHLPFGGKVSLITDARFSGVSTGACIGHVGPEALAGGPVGRLRDGDWIDIRIDLRRLEGRIDMVGDGENPVSPAEGARILAQRDPHPDLAADSALPDDTRLWAALQAAGGGTWRGCVYDVDRIVRLLEAGRKALEGAHSGREEVV